MALSIKVNPLLFKKSLARRDLHAALDVRGPVKHQGFLVDSFDVSHCTSGSDSFLECFAERFAIFLVDPFPLLPSNLFPVVHGCMHVEVRAVVMHFPAHSRSMCRHSPDLEPSVLFHYVQHHRFHPLLASFYAALGPSTPLFLAFPAPGFRPRCKARPCDALGGVGVARHRIPTDVFRHVPFA
eukprot:scaffold1141_cov333-Pavlova_lutheri.AAC.21